MLESQKEKIDAFYFFNLTPNKKERKGIWAQLLVCFLHWNPKILHQCLLNINLQCTSSHQPSMHSRNWGRLAVFGNLVVILLHVKTSTWNFKAWYSPSCVFSGLESALEILDIRLPCWISMRIYSGIHPSILAISSNHNNSSVCISLRWQYIGWISDFTDWCLGLLVSYPLASVTLHANPEVKASFCTWWNEVLNLDQNLPVLNT